MKPCVKMYFMRRIRKMISLKFIYFTSLRIQFYTKGNIKGDGKSTVTFIYSQYKFNWLNKAISTLLNNFHFIKSSLKTNIISILD